MKEFETGEVYTRKNGKRYLVVRSSDDDCITDGVICAFSGKNHCQKVRCYGQMFIRETKEQK